LLITTNKVVATSDLNIIKRYVKKDLNDMNYSDIISLRLTVSKFYLKILSIFYIIKNTNFPISSNIIENIIKYIYIFNNIMLVSKPHIIKILFKSDMAVIWINIWDFQSNSNTKMLINKCFNIRSYITMICSTNMNPSVFQCKNC